MPRASRFGVRGLGRYSKGPRKGQYYIDLRWRAPDGAERRHQELLAPGTTQLAAKTRAHAVLAAAYGGTLDARRGLDKKPVTLREASQKYLEWCKTNGRNFENKERYVATLNRTLGAATRLEKISELSAERHKRVRLAEGKKPSTVNRELVTLKHFLGCCVDWGWLATRPKVTLLRERAPRVRWLTDAESKKLARALAAPRREHFRRVVQAALLSGQRLSVIIGLKKSDVDLRHRTLSYVARKRGTKQPVTKHVPISDALAEVIEAAIADSKKEYVFVAGRGGASYTRSGVSGFFRKVIASAGIVDFHFHDLRHHFATEVRRAGHGLDVVQALLGHENQAMTARYAHLGREELSAAAGAVNRLPVLPDSSSRKAAQSGDR